MAMHLTAKATIFKIDKNMSHKSDEKENQVNIR